MNEYDEKIFENVSMTIRECLNDKDIHIELTSSLVDDLDIDSSDGYCLIMGLEEIYNIVIDDKIIETLTTVESVVNIIKERIEQD